MSWLFWREIVIGSAFVRTANKPHGRVPDPLIFTFIVRTGPGEIVRIYVWVRAWKFNWWRPFFFSSRVPKIWWSSFCLVLAGCQQQLFQLFFFFWVPTEFFMFSCIFFFGCQKYLCLYFSVEVPNIFEGWMHNGQAHVSWPLYWVVIRSYHGGITRSHPNSEVKHRWACLVLRWGTTREPYVLNDLFFFTRRATECHCVNSYRWRVLNSMWSSSVGVWMLKLGDKKSIHGQFFTLRTFFRWSSSSKF